MGYEPLAAASKGRGQTRPAPVPHNTAIRIILVTRPVRGVPVEAGHPPPAVPNQGSLRSIPTATGRGFAGARANRLRPREPQPGGCGLAGLLGWGAAGAPCASSRLSS